MGWGGSRGRRGGAQEQRKPVQSHEADAGPAARAPPTPQPRAPAAQWRFACRVLRRHSPEERVQDAKRQLRLGDHVLVRYSWDSSEQHGIICGAGEARRADRQEPHWVAHWDGSRLQCSPLSQLSKGGELARIVYPHWACSLLLPVSSTTRPQVIDERLVEAAADDAVARRANSAVRSGWTPRWAHSADLEFCIETKTGGAGLPWELHGRQALASLPLHTLGCQLRGERRPSLALGTRAGGAHRAAPTPAPAPAPPGFAVQPWPAPPSCAGAVPPVLAAGDAAAYAGAHGRFAAAGGAGEEAAWGAGWWEAGWPGPSGRGAPAQKPAAGSSLSADAQIFVPQSPNWDGIYQ